MGRIASWKFICAVLVFTAASARLVQAQAYRTAAVDEKGRLRIVSASGAAIVPPRLEGQLGFGAAQISPDHRTVGWLVLYPFPVPASESGAKYAREHPIAGKLVIYRAGRVVRAISTDQTFWDWRFEDQGRRVAYSTGPTHGRAAECVLLDLSTGKTAARWSVGTGKAPAWAANLRQ
jgi:hypothetical protein